MLLRRPNRFTAIHFVLGRYDGLEKRFKEIHSRYIFWLSTLSEQLGALLTGVERDEMNTAHRVMNKIGAYEYEFS